MKKYLFLSLIAVSALFVACDKDKERTEQTFNVEIYRIENDSVEVAPEFSIVWLYDGALKFDWDSSAISYYNGKGMTLVSGEQIQPIQEIFEETHKYTLENIKNGEYFLFAYCPVARGTADYGSYPNGYRKITVNQDIHNTTLKFVFTDNDRFFGYYIPFKEK